MSIPKEPRQLMINLMYIVLTALLALNVSAEIINAFFTMDDSLKGSNAIVSSSNEQLMKAIGEQSKAYSQFQPFKLKAEEAQVLSNQLVEEVEKLRNLLIEAAGGLGEDQLPKRKTDKDITTRLLLNEGRGIALQQHIEGARAALLNLIEDEAARTEIAAQLPLKIQQPKNEKTWVESNFNQMPVAAILPILRKFENDAKVSEAVVLNYFLSKMGDVFYKPDAFIPVISSNKSYVIKGEPYKGEIVLAAYSTTADNISISVDGRPLDVEDGKAVFRESPSSIGTRTHNMRIELADPLTGEIQAFEQRFAYQVGTRSATVSADNMNVMYIGVDNPITVAVAGAATESIEVDGSNLDLSVNNRLVGQYVAKPRRLGVAEVKVSADGFPETAFKFRVKRIPDPVLKFANKTSGEVSIGEFKAQQGILAILEGFDFNAKCRISSFEIARVPRSGDPLFERNNGPRFTGRSRNLMDKASRGDRYFFDDIKVKCPGDEYHRKLNGLIFKVK